jgi:hypothetical protein
LQFFLSQPRSNFLNQIFRDEGIRNSDLGKAQPLIVAVNCVLPITPQLFTDISHANTAPLRTSLEFTLQNATQELVDLIVTCPTEHDAVVLRGLQAVDLPSGHTIFIPEISKSFQISDSNSYLLRYLSSHQTALKYKLIPPISNSLTYVLSLISTAEILNLRPSILCPKRVIKQSN